MRIGLPACALLFALAQAPAQQHELSNKEAFDLYGRAVQLMQSTSLAIPDLARAGAPITENARAAVATLRGLGRQNASVTYAFLTNVRSFLLLADSLPKPEAFPDEAARQFAELRVAADRADANFRAQLDSKERQLRNPDRDELSRYAEANARTPAPQAGRQRVVFLGDSITDGWRLNEYFPERDFLNRGISGQTTGEMLGRMKADVIDLKPEAVLILAGTNDIAHGVSLKTAEDNLVMITELAELHKIKPLLASAPPVSDYHKDQNPLFERTRVHSPQTIRTLNDWIRSFCREHNYIYVDYYSALVDANGFMKADFADDGLHPNSAGYRVMAPIALAAIEKAAPPEGKRRR